MERAKPKPSSGQPNRNKPPFLIVRLWPQHHEDERELDALLETLRRHRRACDEVWFCTACGFPTLDAHRRSAERMAWAAQRMRAADFLPGLQIANTLGHGDLPMWPAEGATWPRMVGHDGKEAPMCACPRSAELHAYLREMVKAYAAWQPSSVWIDDDLRMHHHPPVNWACFCDRCLGAFAWETRHEWDRGPLVEALNERDDGSLRLAWTQFNGESLALVARTIAQAVHEVAPDCRLGLQHAGPEWGLYNGASLEPVFKMLAEVSGHPVGSRPGGGFYHDHRPREMITKALELGRQVARLSGCVDRVYAEVENFTHVAMGKTPHGTVVESSLDLALGCRGLSFAILCSGHELPAGYEPILARIAAWRAFWEQYVRANANTMPGGLEVVYGMNHAGRLMDADEKPFAWASANFARIYQFAAIGMPLCAESPSACATILRGDAVPGLSDAELRAVFRGGVLMDGRAAWRVQERGLGELLGVRVNKVERAECFERFTTDPLNGASRGQFWKLFFIPAENHVYRLEPVAPDARVLGQYEDHRGQTTGAATVITQNKEGGRAAVFAYDGFESVVSAARRAQLLAVADWISRGRLPVWIETPAQVMAVPRMTGEGKLRSVFLLNAGMDRSPALRLRLRAVSGATARWQTPPGSRSTVPLRKQSHDVIAEIPALAPWSVGCLLLQPGTV